MKHIKKTALQLVRFGTIGAVNTAIDAGVYIGLTRSIDWFTTHYLTAAVVAFFIAGINGFLWNKHWTFKDKRKYTHRQAIRYLVNSSIALVLNQLLLWSMVSAGLHDIAGKLLASVLAGLVNFGLQKWWTFKIIEEVVDSIESAYNDDDN